MPRQLYKKLIVFERMILADHPSGGKENRRLRKKKKNKEGWELYLGEKEEGRFGRDRVAGHARSIVVTLGDYSRLWRVNCCFVVSSYTVCNTVCFCECTHCRAASSQLWRLHARFDSDIIALDPVTCDSMVIACVVMPRVLSVDTRISGIRTVSLGTRTMGTMRQIGCNDKVEYEISLFHSPIVTRITILNGSL